MMTRPGAFRNWRYAYFAYKTVQRGRNASSPSGASCIRDRWHFCSRSLYRDKSTSNGRQQHFVSEHFRLEHGEVESYLRRHELTFRCTEEHAIVEDCPFCPPTNQKASNLYKLYILLDSGIFHCHRCKNKGTWFDLRKRVGGYGRELLDLFNGEKIGHEDGQGSVIMPGSKRQETYVRDLWQAHNSARRFLIETRGLKTEVLKRYGVGAGHFPMMDNGKWNHHLCITFPMYDGRGRLVRHKIRSIETKSGMRLDPKGGSWGMFGLDGVPSDADEVVITEGEFDALSVFQATGRPAISLPNGASSLPVSLLPSLERFKTIYLWMDDDVPGQDGAKQFSRKLGAARCRSVRGTGCKDANDALRENKNIEEMISQSRAVPHEGLLTFDDIRDDVWHELANVDVASGVKCRSLPRLNDYIKGHRRGELTIFSGHTGTGKTTILSQLALDFCLQGVPTLWGSFEIANVRLVGRLLKQFQAAHGDSSDLLSSFDEWADRYSELPMYYMRYHGSEEIDRVIETMEYANYVHDCSHVVLDNLQFMTSGQGHRSDRFAALDSALGKLREFSTIRNTHVSLVVHPRKEQDQDKIQTASVFGSAKATQEADNVIILQRGQDGPMLDIRKNRYDGNLGTISLRFDRKRLIYSQMDSSSLGWVDKWDGKGKVAMGDLKGINGKPELKAKDGQWGEKVQEYANKRRTNSGAG